MPFLLWWCYVNAVEMRTWENPKMSFIEGDRLQTEVQLHSPVPVVNKWQLIRACCGFCDGEGKEKSKVSQLWANLMSCSFTSIVVTPNSFLLPLLPHNPSQESCSSPCFRATAQWKHGAVVTKQRAVWLCVSHLWPADNVRVLDNADKKHHMFLYLCCLSKSLVTNSSTDNCVPQTDFRMFAHSFCLICFIQV